MSRPITAAVVRAARDLLADEAHWTQGSYAATEENTPVLLKSPLVRRWCLVGAVMKVLDYLVIDDSVQLRLTNKAVAAGLIKRWTNVSQLNDSRGHADVLAFMDRLATAYERKKAASNA